MNVVVIMGRLTREVELRYTSSGTAVGNVSIAYNKRFRRDGEWEDKTSFFDVVAFGKQAETIHKYFVKGSRILLRGELDQQQWTANDGSNRNKTVIVVNEFDFVERKEKTEDENRSTPGDDSHSKESRTENLPDVDIDEDEIPF